MSSPLQTIKKLIPSLPEKDIPLANKFVEEKNWEALKELTWSSLLRLESALKKDPVPQKYAGLDQDSVRELALVCSDYYYLIYPEDLEEDEERYDDDVEGD